MRLPLQRLQLLLTAFQDDLPRFRALCVRIPNWERYFDLAERHGVAGLLHRALRQAGQVLPEKERIRIDRRVVAGRLIQMSNYQGIRRILEGLETTGIQAVVLKGPVLAERLYGDYALRYSSDLDLLIVPEDLKAVEGLLSSLGYHSQDPSSSWYARDYTHQLSFAHAEFSLVEVHFHLLVEFGVTIPARDFLSRSVPFQMRDGSRCRILNAEDEAFYLLLHAIHHEFVRFCWLCDIWNFARLHPGLDWDVVFQRARENHVQEALLYAVEVLRRRLGLECPAPLRLFERQARQAFASLLLRIHDTLTPLDSPGTLINLFFKTALCDSAVASVRFLGHNLWRITRRRCAATCRC